MRIFLSNLIQYTSNIISFQGGYPARLKHVYVVMAPFWFRASMVVLSSFLREKIRDRVRIILMIIRIQSHIIVLVMSFLSCITPL